MYRETSKLRWLSRDGHQNGRYLKRYHNCKTHIDVESIPYKRLRNFLNIHRQQWHNYKYVIAEALLYSNIFRGELITGVCNWDFPELKKETSLFGAVPYVWVKLLDGYIADPCYWHYSEEGEILMHCFPPDCPAYDQDALAWAETKPWNPPGYLFDEPTVELLLTGEVRTVFNELLGRPYKFCRKHLLWFASLNPKWFKPFAEEAYAQISYYYGENLIPQHYREAVYDGDIDRVADD